MRGKADHAPVSPAVMLTFDICFYVGILCQAFFSKLYILTSAHLQMLLLATA
jgi:hypothetical protein